MSFSCYVTSYVDTGNEHIEYFDQSHLRPYHYSVKSRKICIIVPESSIHKIRPIIAELFLFEVKS